MTRARGWSPRGEPLLAKVPHGDWKTLTFLAGLRHDRIVAPCVIDGPINGVSFTAWVEQFLVPTLNRGDIVVADNLGSHKGKAARNAIRGVGAKLFFLPAYSPESNRDGLRQAQGYCARPTNDPSRQHGERSATCLPHSAPTNAPPIFTTPDMLLCKLDRL